MISVIADKRTVQKYLASILQANEMFCCTFWHSAYPYDLAEA
jgi:hypothetical protein